MHEDEIISAWHLKGVLATKTAQILNSLLKNM